MKMLAICPFCKKTVSIEKTDKTPCPECGTAIPSAELRKQGLIVDSALEAKEFAIAKDWFVNTEFLSAEQHFLKALDANKNSYLSMYFSKICDIYLNESSPNYDIMNAVLDAVNSSLTLLSRASVKISDRLAFVIAMLNETKIVIMNRLRSHDALYETDIESYRKEKISDLAKLSALFKIDGETLMTYSPDVAAALYEIADCAVALCHKTVQTVAIGEELHSPTDQEYNELVRLNGDYCFYASSFVAGYDVNKYTPDFSQVHLLVEKVDSRFEKYEAKDKHNIKKHLIGEEAEYNDILAECKKAVTFVYITCFRSLCDKNYPERNDLIKHGIKLLYKLITPRVVLDDRKKPDIHLDKFVFVAENLATLSDFLDDASKVDDFAAESLKEFYASLLDIIYTYFVPEFEKYTKHVNKLKSTRDDDYKYYGKLLFNVVCCCASALKVYVPLELGKDKDRIRLVKICKAASEDFLMLWDYKIAELEQSNIYRPILDVYNAVLKETED